MKKGKSSNHRQEVRAILLSLMSKLQPSGVEFLDIRGTASCRLGLPCWRESKNRRARRARQEMRIFCMLDDAGSVVVRQSQMSDLHAWESRLESKGYECLNQRVGDRGVLHIFFGTQVEAQTVMTDEALDDAAEKIENILAS